MPEPVSCRPPAPGSSVIECDDVVIGPEPEPAESHAESAGARALVRSHSPPLVVHTITADPNDAPYGDVARECSAETLGGVLAVAGAARLHPALAALTVAKASIELASCVHEKLTQALVESAMREAAELCERIGGAPTGVIDRKFMCQGGDWEALR